MATTKIYTDGIKITYRACDGFKETKKFKTMPGARKYAIGRVGDNPERGIGYAVSEDGIGTLEVMGCSLADLFCKESISNSIGSGDYEVFISMFRYGSRDEIIGSSRFLAAKFATLKEANAYCEENGESVDGIEVKYNGVEVTCIDDIRAERAETEECPF